MDKRGRKLSAKQLTKLVARDFRFVIASYALRSVRRDYSDELGLPLTPFVFAAFSGSAT